MQARLSPQCVAFSSWKRSCLCDLWLWFGAALINVAFSLLIFMLIWDCLLAIRVRGEGSCPHDFSCLMFLLEFHQSKCYLLHSALIDVPFTDTPTNYLVAYKQTNRTNQRNENAPMTVGKWTGEETMKNKCITEPPSHSELQIAAIMKHITRCLHRMNEAIFWKHIAYQLSMICASYVATFLAFTSLSMNVAFKWACISVRKTKSHCWLFPRSIRVWCDILFSVAIKQCAHLMHRSIVWLLSLPATSELTICRCLHLNVSVMFWPLNCTHEILCAR